jgi:CRISPR-associated protein Csd1
MGLLQQAVVTYDTFQNMAGIYNDGEVPLAPLGHNTTKADAEITIDRDGLFVSASAVGREDNITIIPVTEKSSGRTSKANAHPLCDNLEYLSSISAEKHMLYINDLEEWANSEFSHPKLMPILTYVKRGTIIHDLMSAGVIELDGDGNVSKPKCFIRWRVLMDDGSPDECWKDKTLFEAHINHLRSLSEEGNKGICMISGDSAVLADQHIKGIVSLFANAKLISDNDKTNFTYRGRFEDSEQALSVSFEASQKAHNALKWVVSNKGVIQGGRMFVCWCPQGIEMPSPMRTLRQVREAGAENKRRDFPDYKNELRETLNGWKSKIPSGKISTVVLAAFDAATKGRLAQTYYTELEANDFLNRLYSWDLWCCWPYILGGFYSPSMMQIINSAFGVEKEERGKTSLKADDKVISQQMQILLHCRVDCARIPESIIHLLVEKASNTHFKEGKNREYVLHTACAVLRKHLYDKYKEEWEMALNPDRMDRSYQFGRWLAVAEKVERATYQKDEAREPNAIKLQSIFCRRPQSIAAELEKQLEKAYFPRLRPGSRQYYKNLFGEIAEKLSCFPESELNQPLDSTYLMGYYLQRNELYKKKGDKGESDMETGEPDDTNDAVEGMDED